MFDAYRLGCTFSGLLLVIVVDVWLVAGAPLAGSKADLTGVADQQSPTFPEDIAEICTVIIINKVHSLLCYN